MSATTERSVLIPIIVSLICIAAIGVVGATLNSANPVGASGEDKIINPPTPREAASTSDTAAGKGTNGEGSGAAGSSYQSLTTCVPFLNSTFGTLLVLGGVLAFAFLIYARYNAPLALFTGWTVLPPVMLGYFILTACGPGGGGFSASQGSSLVSPETNLVSVSTVPPWTILLLVGALVAGGVAMLYRSTGDGETVVLEPEAESDVELDRFAAAAGRAADRIEAHDQDIDNAVYRAWDEMVALLDVEAPESYSAGEFADAAIELGMAEEHVQEITQLFNEVRYGNRSADTREERAVHVLRRIEDQYGDGSYTTAAKDSNTAASESGESS